jgi:hypothetical protein
VAVTVAASETAHVFAEERVALGTRYPERDLTVRRVTDAVLVAVAESVRKKEASRVRVAVAVAVPETFLPTSLHMDAEVPTALATRVFPDAIRREAEAVVVAASVYSRWVVREITAVVVVVVVENLLDTRRGMAPVTVTAVAIVLRGLRITDAVPLTTEDRLSAGFFNIDADTDVVLGRVRWELLRTEGTTELSALKVLEEVRFKEAVVTDVAARVLTQASRR